jgi:hypothetical protein
MQTNERSNWIPRTLKIFAADGAPTDLDRAP